MQITHEHQSLYDTTKRFIEEQINPNSKEWERDGIFPAREVFKKMGDLGLLGIAKPESVGGLGLDYGYQLMFAEALGHCNVGGIPMAIGVQTDMATPALARFGSDYLKENFLKPAVAGDMVAAIAVSEPGAGSDVAGIKTTARREGDEYVISGQKMWITNGTQADWACVLCNTGDSPEGGRHGNKSLIVVPLDTKGVDRRTKLDKLGQRSSDTAIIFFDDVRVPARNLIGSEGKGFTYQMQQFQEERLFLSASIVQAMDNCISETATYTRQRNAFGQSILDNQFVQFRLSELKTEVEALRALIYRAADDMLAGQDVTLMASMAKLKAGKLGREVPDACLQFWGGQGFMWDNFVAQMYRDLRLHAIGGGADEIMLGIISKRLGFGGKKKA
ncbi:acyl-CoA dehydrogenase family protein [Stenotrophobium rhamnosiphilum]|uniref:Acyl-CoA dehydrogenase n=1 Tax=Stenotrophobium rhamnosiphilum TaxID=2029166 RepID=A0A2T5MHF9_9GAMM|nr:acyl-CoA dehydrogenase family protein [Stenotrophobium rhamnosiphilum]PTU31979.1 acyl-CoA dehydrogenase [Stenotrophobium rhamnosiphilum]